MSVIKKLDVDQSAVTEWSELNEFEKKFVELFRLLDDASQQDIMRFISVLLNP